ncbi:unnamed protein product, partial [Mesorhabditis spiculigera]
MDPQELGDPLGDPPASSQPEVVPEDETRERLRGLEEDKTRLEQQIFGHVQEVTALRTQLQNVSTRNEQLTEQLSSCLSDITAKEHKARLMEAARDEYAEKKTRCEEQLEKYKHEKEDRDAIIRTITREKHQLNEELVTVREKLGNLKQENVELNAERKAWDREKREIDAQLQRVKDEVAVLSESKRWLLNEVSARDTKISQLRIEASNNQIERQNEKSRLTDETVGLQDRVTELEAELSQANAQLTEKVQAFKKQIETQQQAVYEAEEELRGRVNIASQYKEALDNANLLIEELKSSDEHSVREAAEIRQLLEEAKEQMESRQLQLQSELESRNERISDLEDELRKANELLQSGNNFGSISDEELERIAPAAAATSKLLRSGMTLSQFYREYARVTGELEEQKYVNSQLENELRIVVEQIENNMPDVARQREQLERTLDHNDRLSNQLDGAAEEKRQLVAQKDAATRELTFTKVELERFQREHIKLKEQTTQLLFVLESERMAAVEQMPQTPEEQRRMYTSIASLQNQNVQLQMELENVQRDAKNKLEEAVRQESQRLREELDLSKRELENINASMGRLQTAMGSLEQQRDRLRDLVERGSLDPEAADLRKRNVDLQNELAALKARYQLVEKRNQELKEETEKRIQIADDRVVDHNGRMNELKLVQVSLQAELDMQKQIALSTKAEYDKFISKFRAQERELTKSRQAQSAVESKLSENNDMMVKQQDEMASLKVENRALREDVEQARSTTSRLEGELRVYQEMSKTHQNLIAALGDAERRMQLGDDLKVTRLESLLESTTIERDQLRATNQSLSEQLSSASRLSGETEKRLTGDRDLLRTQLEELKKESTEAQQELASMRTKLDAAQKQAAAYESTNVSLNPERLANRNTYLEAQVEELKVKLSEAENRLARADHELLQLTNTSDSVETNLKEQTDSAQQTIGRLNGLVEAAEKRNKQHMEQIASVREELQRQGEELVAREAEWTREKTQLEQKVAVLEVQLNNSEALRGEHERRLTELKGEHATIESRFTALEEEKNQLLRDKDSLDVSLETLRAQLSTTKIELQNANARATEELRTREIMAEQDKQRQAAANQRVDEAEQAYQAAQKRTEELLQQITGLSNELTVLEAKSKSLDSDPTSTGDAATVSEGGMQVMQQVVRFLREEKEKAQERSMVAEMDLKRLRLEIEELREVKAQTTEQLRQRELEVEQNKVALAQKNELMNRLQKLTMVAKENMHLKAEKAKLTDSFAMLNNKHLELDSQVNDLRVEKERAEQNAASANALAAARQNELNLVRQRIGETAQQKITALKQQLDKITAEKEAESTKLAEMTTALEAKHKFALTQVQKFKEVQQKHQQVVVLARKQRDQIQALQQQGGAVFTASDLEKKDQEIAALQEQIAGLTKTKDESEKAAQATLDRLEAEKDEATARAAVMHNMLEKSNDRSKELGKQLEAEKEAHARTRAEAALQQAAIQPSSSRSEPSQSVSRSTQPVPAVPTPATTTVTLAPTLPQIQQVDAVPSAPVSASDSHPAVPSSQQPSFFSAFGSSSTSYRPTPATSVFGSPTLFKPQPQPSVPTPATPSTTAPAQPSVPVPSPSVPHNDAPPAMVAGFFGLRPAAQNASRASAFSSSAPADPAPAAATARQTPPQRQSNNTETINENPVAPVDEPDIDQGGAFAIDEELLPAEQPSQDDVFLSTISSSSGGETSTRKRGPQEDPEQLPKRHRDSPGENLISSSRANEDVLMDANSLGGIDDLDAMRQPDVLDEDIEGGAMEGDGEEEEEVVERLPEVNPQVLNDEDDDDDIQEIPDHPLQHQGAEQENEDDDDDDDDVQVISSDSEGQGVGDTDSEDDTGLVVMDDGPGEPGGDVEEFGYSEGEDLDDDDAGEDFGDEGDGVEADEAANPFESSDHDGDPNVDEQTQDAEVVDVDLLEEIGGEREAASAIEEADDEGRAESGQRVAPAEPLPAGAKDDASESCAQQPAQSTTQRPRTAAVSRAPIQFDILPSSSNETADQQPTTSAASSSYPSRILAAARGAARGGRAGQRPPPAGPYVAPSLRQARVGRGAMGAPRGRAGMAPRGAHRGGPPKM